MDGIYGICQDIQYNLSSCNIGKAYIIKKLSRNPKTKSTVVKNKEEEITMRWKEYLEDLYEGNNETTNNIVIEEMYRVGGDEIGPSIMKSEFIKAIHDLKSNKAAGIDEIPAELWKHSGEETRDILFKMVEKDLPTKRFSTK